MPFNTNRTAAARRMRLGCAVLVACTFAAGPHAFAADPDPQSAPPATTPTASGQPHDTDSVDERKVGACEPAVASGCPGPRYYDIEAFKARSMRALGAYLMARTASSGPAQ